MLADLTTPFNAPGYFFHDGKQEEWERLNSGDVVRYRNNMVAHLKELEDEGIDLIYKEKGMGIGGVKRGIIVTGGDGVSLVVRRRDILIRSDGLQF